MTDAHVLIDKLSTFKYYEEKLPLYLQNSYGFKEHFRIWFDLLIQNGPLWFNQIIQNGNFVNRDNWTRRNSTAVSAWSVANNTMSLTFSAGNAASGRCIYQNVPDIPVGHKIYMSAFVRESNDKVPVHFALNDENTTPLIARCIAYTPTSNDFEVMQGITQIVTIGAYAIIGTRAATT